MRPDPTHIGIFFAASSLSSGGKREEQEREQEGLVLNFKRAGWLAALLAPAHHEMR